jgi:hypothetical protein
MDNEKEPIQLECSDGVAMNASVKAVAKNRQQETEAIRVDNKKGSASADFDNGQMIEQASKRGKVGPREEQEVARQFASKYNQIHQANYCVDQKQPEQNDITDVTFTDNNDKRNQLAIQITASDKNPWSELAKGSFERSGDAYQIHSEAIKEAISKKVERYGNGSGVILVLDGWFSVTTEIIDKFKDDEHAFLQSAGFDEIWFVGDENETTVQLI